MCPIPRQSQAALQALCLVIAAVLALCSAPAVARTLAEGQDADGWRDQWVAWQYKDAIDDAFVQFAGVDTDTIAMGVRCKTREMTQRIVPRDPSTRALLSHAAREKASTIITWRVDQQAPVTEAWVLDGSRLDRDPMVIAAPASSHIAEAMARAQERIAVRLAGHTFIIPAKGANAALARVTTACGRKG
ncbi:hypothetical protein [Limobrevibacterium gyesilva]|uniref:Toxin co-regulated pilus biosynthesis protein Q C-terminal domain-containing protein n=1 Tax=Limobrevibacterium gyesilva TaxID=2991712 RepID=A0AA42CD91_9PROT|nr:hypothetical protein [Limobrevibacterium gyesilva]MCW3473464.1 hypothetical protein [Limobrevibacterium gyesilva]